ncbi:hypothetical protein ZWY2020_048826 [Hordeum vulgare]|nr:hypothetical protein ZWY2020_048826 [Hordeum vulgare]
MAAMPRVLPNELVEEILLLRAPDEPDCLLCASLVCKTWSDIVFHRAFCRRLHELHGEPPILGFLHNWNDEDGTLSSNGLSRCPSPPARPPVQASSGLGSHTPMPRSLPEWRTKKVAYLLALSVPINGRNEFNGNDVGAAIFDDGLF